MKKQTQESEIDPYDYSDEAERKNLRLQLYNDLKWQGGPAIYPTDYPTFSPDATDKETEPSLETWRRGYLVLKAKERQRIFWLQTAATGAVIIGALWVLKRVGFL